MTMATHSSSTITGNTRRTPGFTLIELLVVIAIIALLISILLPSLESARKQSKLAACLSNMKAIGTTSRVYEADDANGWCIPTHALQFQQNKDNPTYIGAYEWGGKSGIGSPGFVPGGGAGFEFLTSKFGTKAGFGPSTRPMNALLYPGGFKDNLLPRYDRVGATQDTTLRLDVYKCPGDDGPPRGAHCEDWVNNSERSSYDHFGNSYAANVFNIAVITPGSPMYSNSPFLRPASRVPTPARTLMYEENIGRWAWAAKQENPDCKAVISSLNGVDPGPTKAIRGWHGRDWTFNRNFVDAHAEAQKVIIEDPKFPVVNGYYVHYRVERVHDDPDMQENHTCIIVRGPGWQKDTLPAALVETGLVRIGSAGGRPSYENCAQDSGS